MITRRHIGQFALLMALWLPIEQQLCAEDPTRFTFTPTFKDPEPGKRQWEKSGTTYVEILPSGRRNTFRVQKRASVHGLKGIILQKIDEPNFFVFVADSESPRPELWWWRDKGPWNFMGLMRDVQVPMSL
jgi:hypothetical protein